MILSKKFNLNMTTILNVKINRDKSKIKALNNFKAYSAHI